MIWDFIKFGISVVTGRVHLYYIRSSLWCRIVRRRGGNKKWLRHGRLMQAKTRIQWPSRRINLRNNAQDRYLWLWRVTLLSMIWMWCLGPYFTTMYSLHPLYNLLQHQKANILLYKVLFFIQVLSSENKLYDDLKSLNHKINAFWIFCTTFYNPCFLQMCFIFSWQDLLRSNQIQATSKQQLSSWVVDLGSNLNS